MPLSRISPISAATAFLLKLTTNGGCEQCGVQCTWDHLDLHYVSGSTTAPVKGNTYLVLCRACHWYIHAMMVSAPQQQVLAEQRSPGRKRVVHAILRGGKTANILNYQRNPLDFLRSESSGYPSTKTGLRVN